MPLPIMPHERGQSQVDLSGQPSPAWQPTMTSRRILEDLPLSSPVIRLDQAPSMTESGSYVKRLRSACRRSLLRNHKVHPSLHWAGLPARVRIGRRRRRTHPSTRRWGRHNSTIETVSVLWPTFIMDRITITM